MIKPKTPKKESRNFVYIVECSDGTLYTGWTTDIKKRLRTHNDGKGPAAAKYTKSRRPVTLVYIEEMPDKTSALKREAAIKKLRRSKKLELIASHTPEPT